MNSYNRISASISEEEIAEVRAALRLCREKMPFLVSLNAQERRKLPKLGEKSVGFDEKCAKYIATRPEFMPGFITPEEIAKDRALRGQLQEATTEAVALAADMQDTLLVVGSDIYMGDLAYYQGVHQAGRRGIPGAEAIYVDLQSRFPGGGRPSAEEPSS